LITRTLQAPKWAEHDWGWLPATARSALEAFHDHGVGHADPFARELQGAVDVTDL
jgi:hypothetical protein